MNVEETTNTYAADAFRRKLYEGGCRERNRMFGFDYLQRQPLLQRHLDNYMCNNRFGANKDIVGAPKDYYFDMRVNDSEKAIIGPLDTRPNLYNDNVLPYTRTFEKPMLYRSWEPLTTTATPVMKGQYVRFIPKKKPCEVAPNNDSTLWVTSLNPRMYERKLIQSAKSQPYANHYRRQGLANLISLNVRSNNDPYTKVLRKPEDGFCESMARNGGTPPAVTSF